jgi:glycosyltransferase involved in cell wall biosynthesis
MPKISVITPCYNAQAYIARTVESVLAQSFVNWEMVIVDDGSTDDTAQIAARFISSDSRIKLIRQENGGVCRARNAGFTAASTESTYLLFLDQDDCLKPEMLANLESYLDDHRDAGMAHCAFELIDESEQPATDYRDFERYAFDGRSLSALPPGHVETPFESIFWNCPILPSACLMRRSVYETTRGWDEHFGQGNEDVDLFLRFSLSAPVHFVPQKLVRYRIHSSQASKRTMRQHGQQFRLFNKWLSENSPAGEKTSWLFGTWKLYEGKLVPRFWLRRARERLIQRDILESMRCLLRSLKHWLLYLSLPFRKYLWRGA